MYSSSTKMVSQAARHSQQNSCRHCAHDIWKHPLSFSRGTPHPSPGHRFVWVRIHSAELCDWYCSHVRSSCQGESHSKHISKPQSEHMMGWMLLNEEDFSHVDGGA